MLEEQKQMFNNGRISIKDYGDFFIVFYRIKKRNISQKIYKQENIKEQISGFLIDVYFEYEYNGTPLTQRQISRLLMVDETATSKLLDKIYSEIKNNSNGITSA